MAIEPFEIVYITDSGDMAIPNGFYITGPRDETGNAGARYIFRQGVTIVGAAPQSANEVNMTGSVSPTLLNSIAGPTMERTTVFGLTGIAVGERIFPGAAEYAETGKDLSLLAFGAVLGITETGD